MPGPYREGKRVRCRVGARCGGGVKTPPYKREDSMAAAVRWRAGHARPLPGGAKGKVSGRGNGGKEAKRLIIQ